MKPGRRLALAAGVLLLPRGIAWAQEAPPARAPEASPGRAPEASPGRAQEAPLPGFIALVPSEGRATVQLAVAQVVRLGRVEGHTVIDTAAFVQQRSSEPLDAIARRLAEAGLRLVPLTDLNGARTWLAADRIVLVRDSGERHAASARAAIVVVGLRFNTDVAVRESPAEVMAALRRALP